MSLYKVLERGSSFLKLQLSGASGRRYDVKVNNVTRKNVAHDSVLTFTDLSPGVRYTVQIYIIPREYYRIFIQNNSRKDALNFAEVQVIDYNGKMVSRDPSMIGSVRQTDTRFGGHPGRAIDGITNGIWNRGSVIHTSHGGTRYWVLEFRKLTSIKEVRVYNRTDCCKTRLQGCTLVLQDKARRTIFKRTLNGNTLQIHRFNP